MVSKDRRFGALVILHDGKRLGWYVSIGSPHRMHSKSYRYFGNGRYRTEDCLEVTESFATPEEAMTFCAQWSRHPHAFGEEPTP